jgi:hypothetical protein
VSQRFKPPGDSDRLLIAGATGTGKTRAAVHWLSLADFSEMTWIAMDFKGDDTLAKMPVSDVIDIDDTIPERPGLFYVLVEPKRYRSPTSEFFLRAYNRGGVGLLIDETLAIGSTNEGFNTALFMGRSRRIPIIMCTQRPVGMEVNAKAQATFFQTLDLNFADDRESMQKNFPKEEIDLEKRLPEFCSYWYDVRRRYATTLDPMPSEDESFEVIAEKLPSAEPEAIEKRNEIDRIRKGRRIKV